MLKKFLKAIVPPDGSGEVPPGSPNPDVSEGGDGDGDSQNQQQQQQQQQDQVSDEEKAAADAPNSGGAVANISSAAQMSRNPGEVAFFKLLNSELRKCIHFFDKALLEMEIREARVREGIDIMKKANSLMVDEKWSLMGKSLYRLYKDLLLLETYAIMTYCSFSKILKKHDKVTRHNTRIAFMSNVVNKANFTHYPKLLEMITRCERMYGEVSHSLMVEGKSGLYEDERLFINMIHKLNEQVLDTAEGEGAPDTEERKEKRRSSHSPDRAATAARQYSPSSSSISSNPSHVNTLRSLVEENAMNKSSKEGLARVTESEMTMDALVADQKLPAKPAAEEQPAAGLPIDSPGSGEDAKRSVCSASTAEEPSAKRAKSG